MKSKRQLNFRATSSPAQGIPFGARSVGYYHLVKNDGESGKRKYFVQLFWGIEGEGKFKIDNKFYILKPSHICFFMPGDEHWFRAISKIWRYRWLTIDGPLSVSIIRNMNFQKSPQYAGKCPEELFIKLTEEIKEPTIESQKKASLTLYSILISATHKEKLKSKEEVIITQCKEIIKEYYSDPNFDINKLSQILNIHRSRLSRIFHQHTGLTLIEYLQSVRLRKGLILLKETTLEIKKIASICGYRNPDYFARIVKKFTGFIPSRFRNLL